jgi:translation initiation factor 4E
MFDSHYHVLLSAMPSTVSHVSPPPSFRSEWVLWEHKSAGPSKNSNVWKENMMELCKFSTVEDFWRNFAHLPKPSDVFFDGDCKKKVGPELKTVEEYSLFKAGIEPEWGDPANVTGGAFFLCLSWVL